MIGSTAGGQTHVAIDWGYFQAEGRQTRLEVYLGFNRSSLDYLSEGEHFVARPAVVVMIKRRGTIIAFRELEMADRRPQATGYIAQQADFTLKPGSYDLLVVAEDRSGPLVDTTLAIEVPRLRRRGIRISSLQPSYLVRKDATGRQFTKQGLLVVPNAAVVYDREHPLLWYYTEIYGITPGDSLVVETFIALDESPVYIPDVRRIAAANLSFIEWGAVNLAGFTPGDYNLSCKAAVGDETVVSKVDFHVAEPDTTDIGQQSGVDLARGIAAVRPQFNLARYEAADSTTQVRWLARAAARLAKTVKQDSANYLGELQSSWPLAKRYDPGWNTTGRLSELGRVMLLYGLPAGIQVYPATNSTTEYQVWDYSSLDSGRVVVFSYSAARAEYILAHGTLPGTPFNAGWQDRLPARFAAVEAPSEQATADSTATDSTAVEPLELGPEPEIPEPAPLAQPADTTEAPAEQAATDSTATDSTAVEP
ncbi:MAG: hypothetical protein V3W14_10330, partial [Candidatus Neomarinimicrobiota bacterium]